MVFADRSDAGWQLAARLSHLRGQDLVVLGLPRGGVPVALEVAQVLHAPLDVVLVRKLGVPSQPELAMGAIGEGGVRVLNPDVLWAARVTPDELARVEERETNELDRRARQFRGERPAVALLGKTAVVVDDGIATGSTARAACRVARAHGAAHVVLAAPIAARATVVELRRDVDEVVCVDTPTRLSSIGQWYRDFHQVSDEEVRRALANRLN